MVAGTEADARQNEHRGTLPAGTRLRNYELISVLGHGSFGITYHARDTTLGREVAIKEYLPTSLALREDGSMVVPRSTQAADDFVWGRERFLEEARILATLEGAPSVVRVHDYLEANGTAYMVMGLARGETLEDRLKRGGPLPPPIVEHLLGRLLDGLEEVHKAGFLHRDVKPANIVLDAGSNPTLIDFGASRSAMADRTSALTAIFTPRYAAAEQFTSDRQGPWTDIYGLSATLYHAITGQAPPSSLERALSDTYKPLAELAPPGFPIGLLQGIDAGLAVRTKDRPASIAAWRKTLFPAATPAGDATVVDRRAKPSPPARVPVLSAPAPVGKEPSGRSRLTLYAAAAAVAVLVLAGAGYLLFGTNPGLSPTSSKEPVATGQDAAVRAQAERQRADEEAAKQKAETEARLKAEAETQQKAAAEAQRKAAAEAQQKAEAEAQQKAAIEAQQKADAEARQKAEAEAQQKAAAEAQQKAEADAAAQKQAEAAETALNLEPVDRQRIQVALTSLGFDTHGIDGVFGPYSREMIAGWQRARNQPATGFLTAAQQQALLKEAAPGLAKYDDDQRKAAENRRREEAAARARNAASSPAAPAAGATAPYGGVSCQDASGRRIDFPGATSCPYGLAPAR